MDVNQYLHEHQVKVVINTYHQDAIEAEQIRIARPYRPFLKALARTTLIAAAGRISLKTVSRPELVSEPADNALAA